MWEEKRPKGYETLKKGGGKSKFQPEHLDDSNPGSRQPTNRARGCLAHRGEDR